MRKIASHRAQRDEPRRALDALRDSPQAKRVRKLDRRLDDQAVGDVPSRPQPAGPWTPSPQVCRLRLRSHDAVTLKRRRAEERVGGAIPSRLLYLRRCSAQPALSAQL